MRQREKERRIEKEREKSGSMREGGPGKGAARMSELHVIGPGGEKASGTLTMRMLS